MINTYRNFRTVVSKIFCFVLHCWRAFTGKLKISNEEKNTSVLIRTDTQWISKVALMYKNYKTRTLI